MAFISGLVEDPCHEGVPWTRSHLFVIFTSTLCNSDGPGFFTRVSGSCTARHVTPNMQTGPFEGGPCEIMHHGWYRVRCKSCNKSVLHLKHWEHNVLKSMVCIMEKRPQTAARLKFGIIWVFYGPERLPILWSHILNTARMGCIRIFVKCTSKWYWL